MSVPLCPVVTRNYITIQVSPPRVPSCARSVQLDHTSRLVTATTVGTQLFHRHRLHTLPPPESVLISGMWHDWNRVGHRLLRWLFSVSVLASGSV